METVTEGRSDDPQIAELQARRADLKSQVEELTAKYAGKKFPKAAEADWDALNSEVDDVDETIGQLEKRNARIKQLAEGGAVESTIDSFQTRRPGTPSGDAIYDLSTIRPDFTDPAVAGKQLQSRALKVLETTSIPVADKFRKLGITREDMKANAVALMDKEPDDGRLSRYIIATGSPAYKRAFPKLLHPAGAAMLFNDERIAVQHVMAAERALNLTGAQGGFAVPFELDTTILVTSAGTVNPYRQIARVVNITVDEWRGITSAGVTASFVAEAAEATDNSPTLAQPTVSTERAHAFIQYSIEIGQDWGGLRDSMAELLAEAKDELEGAKFSSGTGTNEPFGITVGTTNTIAAATGQTVTLANLYSLKNGLPPRYRRNGTYVADGAILDRVRQFDTVGSSAAIWVDGLASGTPGSDGRAGTLLGRPVYEASDLPDTPATSAKFMFYGDFSRYLIADRIGLNLELIPHIMGASRRPTGERGIYAYWRVGAKVIDANAIRALLGTA